jgi:hypothetical protein
MKNHMICAVHHILYYYDYEMIEDDMDRACSMHRRDEKCLPNCSLIPKRERTGVNGVILKWILRKWVWNMWSVFNA